jgi:Streptomycin adenylyltransferase
MITNLLQEYAAERDELLERIVSTLKQDERFLAAWLTGSFGREDIDEVSDLDLTVVVSSSHSDQLCARPETISARAPKMRLDLFSRFGKIGFAYENNNNAPIGGTATNVMYLPSGTRVDWVLVPQVTAQRPENIKLLFAHIDVPTKPKAVSSNQEQRAKEVTEMVSFFWLMATVVAKYLIRGDSVFVTHWLEQLAGLIVAIERRIEGVPYEYHRGSITSLRCMPIDQLQQLQDLCNRIEVLTPRVIALGGQVWAESQLGVEQWLRMADQAVLQTPSAGYHCVQQLSWMSRQLLLLSWKG